MNAQHEKIRPPEPRFLRVVSDLWKLHFQTFWVWSKPVDFCLLIFLDPCPFFVLIKRWVLSASDDTGMSVRSCPLGSGRRWESEVDPGGQQVLKSSASKTLDVHIDGGVMSRQQSWWPSRTDPPGTLPSCRPPRVWEIAAGVTRMGKDRNVCPGTAISHSLRGFPGQKQELGPSGTKAWGWGYH